MVTFQDHTPAPWLVRLSSDLNSELYQKKTALNFAGRLRVARTFLIIQLRVLLFNLLVQSSVSVMIGQVTQMLFLDLLIVMGLLLYLSRTQCVSMLGHLGFMKLKLPFLMCHQLKNVSHSVSKALSA